jgi:16S rRNA (guanine1207-N2)-methyltransferase
MILAAARALKPGGRLYLVANRQLPYEQVLAKEFRKSGETVRDARYKVLQAVR